MITPWQDRAGTDGDANEKTPPLVAVAMSGGVDSSVAALLVQRAGYRAVGITMKLWTPEEPEVCEAPVDGSSGAASSEVAGAVGVARSTRSTRSNGAALVGGVTGTAGLASGGGADIDPEKTCCTADSAMDAKRVCDQIGIPHFTLDMREDFEERVIRPFQESYLAGETPNPCVNCNSFVKWDALWRRAKAVGADLIATGHYAQTTGRNGRTFITRGGDHGKDQSYFLWGIPPETLSRTLFPLADLPKPEVRRLALEAGLRTARKKESMDICFIPKGDYREFVRDRAGREGAAIAPGRIRGPGGVDLGEHRGLPFYTIGQRKGLGVAWSEPLYVSRLERENNTLVLGVKEDLDCWGFRADRLNLFEPIEGERECLVQYRHRSPVKPAVIKVEGDGWVTVEMREPGYCVSPGQSAVFYDGERLLGGARIKEINA